MGQKILGIDGGFRFLGASLVDHEKAETIGSWVITTEAQGRKGNLSSDAHEHLCSQEIANALKVILEEQKPNYIAIERLSQPRSAATARVLGRVMGVVDTLALFYKIPVLSFGPQSVRKHFGVPKKAPKEEVHKKAQKIVPFEIDEYVPVKDRVHAKDAQAVAVYAPNSPIALQIKAMCHG